MSASVKDTDKGWKRLYRNCTKPQPLSVDVGVFEGDRADAAIAHEYGTAHVPARSFMRSTFDAHDAYRDLVTQLTYDIVGGGLTPVGALEILGKTYAEDCRQRILDGKISPPLSASTIKRKGHGRPLIDTSELVNAITYRILGRK